MRDPADYRSDGYDPYLDPATGILHNTPQLTTRTALDAYERTVFMGVFPDVMAFIHEAQVFDMPLWQDVHRLCFYDIYEWAGELRTIRIEKGQTVFAYPEHIASEAAPLFAELNAQAHAGGSLRRVITLFGEMNIIHPFREGNGRTQRMLFDAAFARMGYRFDYASLSASDLINALVHAYYSNDAPLVTLMEDVLTPLSL